MGTVNWSSWTGHGIQHLFQWLTQFFHRSATGYFLRFARAHKTAFPNRYPKLALTEIYRQIAKHGGVSPTLFNKAWQVSAVFRLNLFFCFYDTKTEWHRRLAASPNTKEWHSRAFAKKSKTHPEKLAKIFEDYFPKVVLKLCRLLLVPMDTQRT